MNKERIERKEITAATALNYVKTIKLFSEKNDILLRWKRITRALPKARRYAYDRAPTIEETFLFSNCFPTEPRTTPTPKATASDVTASGISDLTS